MMTLYGVLGCHRVVVAFCSFFFVLLTRSLGKKRGKERGRARAACCFFCVTRPQERRPGINIKNRVHVDLGRNPRGVGGLLSDFLCLL
jgi:hypothetical protein